MDLQWGSVNTLLSLTLYEPQFTVVHIGNLYFYPSLVQWPNQILDGSAGSTNDDTTETEGEFCGWYILKSRSRGGRTCAQLRNNSRYGVEPLAVIFYITQYIHLTATELWISTQASKIAEVYSNLEEHFAVTACHELLSRRRHSDGWFTALRNSIGAAACFAVTPSSFDGCCFEIFVYIWGWTTKGAGKTFFGRDIRKW